MGLRLRPGAHSTRWWKRLSRDAACLGLAGSLAAAASSALRGGRRCSRWRRDAGRTVGPRAAAVGPLEAAPERRLRVVVGLQGDGGHRPGAVAQPLGGLRRAGAPAGGVGPRRAGGDAVRRPARVVPNESWDAILAPLTFAPAAARRIADTAWFVAAKAMRADHCQYC